MQNNVTEITQKLLRSLDNNYNVIDMPAVIEIISTLEKITITKELLETTRLGKHVNQLRRNTTNELLAKRAKELVKKWRDKVLPDSNGQAESKKRTAKNQLESTPKKIRLNGAQNSTELDFSDNSNSSFKESITSKIPKNIILVNSDSSSSMPDVIKHAPLVEQPLPKKRGRKKGSKNHKNLIDEAESSFSNKLNVSRGNAKVKTTQQLLVDLHIRSNNSKEDLNERAAKLTERVSLIDQTLNANSNRYRRSKIHNTEIVSNVTTTTVITPTETDDEIIVVDDVSDGNSVTVAKQPEELTNIEPLKPEVKSLSIEEVFALLPPIDHSVLNERCPEPRCTCQLIENKTDFTTDDEDVNLNHTFEFVEDENCAAKTYLQDKYNLVGDVDQRVSALHSDCLPNVNGNFGISKKENCTVLDDNGLYINVVPNVYSDNVPKCFSNKIPASENFKKYSISENSHDSTRNLSDNSDTQSTFREWHEVVDAPSYNGEVLKILPYVIID